MPATFEFSPVKLVYGGDALGFHAGHTVFAPGILPGETALVEEVRRQKGNIFARPLKIVKPAAQRIEPKCPYFGKCGGCDYQQLAAEAQTAIKVEILRETLRRLGQVKWESEIPVHSASPWDYRNQAQFKIGATPEGAMGLGFFEAQSNRLVSIDSCPILSPRLNSLLATLRAEPWLSQLGSFKEFEILADHADEKVMLTLYGPWRDHAGALAAKFLAELEGVATVAFAHEESLKVFGAAHIEYRVGEFTYRLAPTAFFQSARFLLPEFVTTVTAGVSGAVAMDLYAGVGLFSLPLAKHFDRVLAVEAGSRAAANLTANAQAIPEKKIRVSAETAFDFLRRSAQMSPDLVVLDPPRAGVGAEALKLLLALKPKMLRYVSCSPPTLARDLGVLLKHGYKIDRLELFDFFPQTYHVESFSQLSLIG